jgi:hypothetical protein
MKKKQKALDEINSKTSFHERAVEKSDMKIY